MKDTKHKQQQQTTFFEKLVTYQQLSEWLSIPIGTLRDWVYKRQIPFLKIGRLIRFDPSEIERWINKEFNQCS